MFVLGIAVELAGRRLENVSGRHAPRRHAPSVVVEEESGFRLRTGKAELAGVAGNAPRGVVLAQCAQTLSNRGFIEPFDRGRGLSQDGFKPFGSHELDRSGAVLAD